MTQFTPASGDNRIAQLEMAYAQGAAPHALCLIGPSSIPKEALARRLAAALLCHHESQRPCGECRGCSRAYSGTHGNLLTLSLSRGERTIKIDALRGLLDALSLHPQEDGPRVILITDLHAMTVQAQNALLKSLEEPEASDHFILTASVEQAVLPTIRSRCELHRLHEGMWPAADRQDLAVEQPDEQVKSLAEKTFFSVRSAGDIPVASALLKDEKDSQDELLALVEQQALACLNHYYALQPSPSPAHWQQAQPLALRRVITAVLKARQYRASNVSWQAVADRLLFVITKEIHQCPLS